jgi:hypothetical protein
MGTVLASLHEEHKARQDRIRQAAFRSITEPVLPPAAPEPTAPEPEPETPVVVISVVNKSVFDIILDEICAYYSVRKIDIFSNRRMRNISVHRHMLIYMVYRMTKWSNPKIGSKVDRDPSSVSYAINKILDDIEKYKEQIFQLEERIAPLLAQKKATMCRQ